MKANYLAISAIAIRVSSMMLGALVTIMIARVSGPESVGQYAMIVLFAGYAATPVKGGLAATLFRQLARARNEAERIHAHSLLAFSYRCLIYTLPVAVTFAGLLLVRLKPPQPEPIWLIALLLIAIITFESWAAIQISALRGANRSLFAQVLDGVLRPLSVTVGAATAFVFADPAMPLTTLCAGYLGGLVITRLLGSIVLLRAAPKVPSSTMSLSDFMAGHGTKSLFFIASSFTANIIANFDVTVGSFLLPVEKVGYYKIVLQLCLVGNALYIGLNFHIAREFAAYQPTDCHQSSDVRAIEKRARYFARLCFLFATAATIAMCVVGKPLAMLLFDIEIPADWRLFAIVGACFMVNGAFGMGSSFLNMNHDERFVVTWSVVSIMIGIPIGYLSVQESGVYGLGTAMLAITLIWNAGLTMRCCSQYAFNPTILNLRKADA